MRRISPFLFLIGCIIVAGSCSQKTVVQKDEALVDKYSRVIGCQGISKLKPAGKKQQEYGDKAAADFARIEPDKKLVTTAVYKSLNSGIFFIHLAYQSSGEYSWDTVNYLYDPGRDELLGFYKCY